MNNNTTKKQTYITYRPHYADSLTNSGSSPTELPLNRKRKPFHTTFPHTSNANTRKSVTTQLPPTRRSSPFPSMPNIQTTTTPVKFNLKRPHYHVRYVPNSNPPKFENIKLFTYKKSTTPQSTPTTQTTTPLQNSNNKRSTPYTFTQVQANNKKQKISPAIPVSVPLENRHAHAITQSTGTPFNTTIDSQFEDSLECLNGLFPYESFPHSPLNSPIYPL